MPIDPRVDAYIASAAPFARPILTHLRTLIHQAVPAAEETTKWGRPFFTLDGRILAMMSAFKAHCTFGFWRNDTGGPDRGESAGGDYGRITCIADLPADDVLIGQIGLAVAQIATPPAKRMRSDPKPALETPPDLAAAFAANPAARAGFDGLPPSGRREYVEWVEEAKRAETRAARIARAVAQLNDGLRLHHKYQ